MKKRLMLCLLFVFTCFISFAQRREKTYYIIENYSEERAKSYLDSATALEDLEGIWQSSDGFKYAIEKDTENNVRVKDKYRVVVVDNMSTVSWWKSGYVKAFIEYSAVSQVYSVHYYSSLAYGKDLTIQKLLGLLENPALFTFCGSGTDIKLVKLYPKLNGATKSGDKSNSQTVSRWSGTGFAISSNGYIATNHHVIDGAKSIKIYGVNGDLQKSYNADVVISDKKNDLALLKIRDSKFKSLGNIPYGSKLKTADSGEDIFVLGYPLTKTMGNEIKLTNGIISSKTGFQGDVSLYQISAPVQPGNSGGPLFDNTGNLIGVVSSKHPDAQNVGYAIKLSNLNNLIDLVSERIALPGTNTIASLSLPNKVKSISKFVYLIAASNEATKKSNNGSAAGSKPEAPVEGDNQNASPEKLYSSARYKYDHKDYAGAYQDVLESLKGTPTGKAYYLKGLIDLCYNYDYKEAAGAFSECISLSFLVDDSRMLRGDSYFGDKNFLAAVEDYDYCIQKDRRNIEALYRRGECKYNMDDLQGAIADYDAVLKYDGLVEFKTVQLSKVYYSKAAGLVSLKKYDEALPVINQALEKDPTMSSMWEIRGEIYYHQGLYVDCVNDMTNAITIDNNQKNSYYYRGLAKMMLNDRRGVYIDLTKAAGLGEERASGLLANMDMAGIDVDSEIYDPLIVKDPKVKRFYNDFLKVQAVELLSDKTIVYFEYSNRSGKKQNISIAPTMHIRDSRTGKQYPVLVVKNISFNPKSIQVENKERVLYSCVFPALPEKTKAIDIIEFPSSSWNIYGVTLR